MTKQKKSLFSVHKTLNGELKVDWQKDYKNEFTCPNCEQENLTQVWLNSKSSYKINLRCKSCGKHTYLGCVYAYQSKHSPISIHQTLQGELKVNWQKEYRREFICPECGKEKLTKVFFNKDSLCKVVFQRCKSCQKTTSLTCQVPPHIFNYCPEKECPNPLCNEIGYNGQKGWIYNIRSLFVDSKCYFCGIQFNSNSTKAYSWNGSLIKPKISPFKFQENHWDLRHFYTTPKSKSLYFHEIYPEWYQLKVKEYLYDLLNSNQFSSDSHVHIVKLALKQLGKVLQHYEIQSPTQILRVHILEFLEGCQTNANRTINKKLSSLKGFFDWLDLETSSLIHLRDFLKININEADWLDEVTRQLIEQHLDKIPRPIARHYLVQVYLAARPKDICQLTFDCIEEENGRWYVKFFQHKTKRWHRILATREIRRIIEEQQKWIRQTIGPEYEYLFCHFRSIVSRSYPNFFNIKPLPQPPREKASSNPMVRIIRILIEEENILDANGQKPHFTGKILRSSRLQEVRVKYGIEAAQLYADHRHNKTTFQHYAPPTREQIAEVDLPFQELLMNPDNKFLPWQSLPESLLKNPKSHDLDLEIAPRLVVYGHCALDPKTPCPVNLYPKCYGCSSFRPSTGKLPLYERQYQGEQQRLTDAEKAGAELASEEAQATIEAMDKWFPELRRLADG